MQNGFFKPHHGRKFRAHVQRVVIPAQTVQLGLVFAGGQFNHTVGVTGGGWYFLTVRHTTVLKSFGTDQKSTGPHFVILQPGGFVVQDLFGLHGHPAPSFVNAHDSTFQPKTGALGGYRRQHFNVAFPVDAGDHAFERWVFGTIFHAFRRKVHDVDGLAFEGQDDGKGGEGRKITVVFVDVVEFGAPDPLGVDQQITREVGDVLFDPFVEVRGGFEGGHVVGWGMD
jgi:hypothetical protein